MKGIIKLNPREKLILGLRL